MDNKMLFPAPLRHKLVLTGIIGTICLMIGIALFIFLKDRTMLLLSIAVCCMCAFRAVSIYRIGRNQAYEVVEGVCASIAPKLFGKYRKIKIKDSDGNESTLLLGKHDRIRIGYLYRFYFKDIPRLTIGNERFDASFASDCFLGFEEIGIPESKADITE